MFKKLRNKLVLINFGITSVVIIVVFSAIYAFATHSANHRPPMPENKIEIYSDDIEDVVMVSLENEKRAAASDLLITLIVAGIAIEFAVVLVSYFLAEEAIKPVREAYEAQKIFIANASHEIKTPLAAISANLEAADIKNNKWISNIEKETVKLATLNSELLDLARTDLAKGTEIREIDLGDLVEKTISEFEPRMTNIDFRKNITTRGKTRLASLDFLQIFEILMDNAIKYCDKKIELKISNRELIILNDGTQISEAESERIFERFYQTDKTAEGVGLGLSIAKSIADRNGWNITAKSNNGLTSFCLKF